MRPAAPLTGATVVALVGVLAVAGCTRDDPSAGSDEQPTTTPVATTAAATRPAASEPASSLPRAEPSASIGDPPGSTAETAPTLAVTTAPVAAVPESGVPGLDSDDAFCAAWSRFGGSWQVIQVAANFAPDPSVVPRMEVAASPVIGDAFDAMFATWPDELDEERELVADGFFGPLDRRAEAALVALDAAGASDAEAAAIGDAWVAALAGRDLDDPVLLPDLTDEQWALVDAAAAVFAAERVDFVDDPSLRIVVETPRTDAFLATACPDQGALTGGEIDAG